MEQNHVNLDTFQGAVLNLTKSWFKEMIGEYVEKGIVRTNFQNVAKQVFQFLSGKITF